MSDVGYSIGGLGSAEWKEFNEEMKRMRAIKEKADSACAETLCTLNDAISAFCHAITDPESRQQAFREDLEKDADTVIQMAESMAHIRSAMNDPKPGIGFGGIV